MDLLKQYHMQGLVNALIEHHPNIGDMISNRYLKVMFKMPKMGHLPKPASHPFQTNSPLGANVLSLRNESAAKTLHSSLGPWPAALQARRNDIFCVGI
jgi:hypothetical protein